eukprot:6396096-Pyramimonas_sp.AAC.1
MEVAADFIRVYAATLPAQVLELSRTRTAITLPTVCPRPWTGKYMRYTKTHAPTFAWRRQDRGTAHTKRLRKLIG